MVNLKQKLASNDNSWTQSEKLCYIAHIWADKEIPYPCLQDFDFTDMASAAKQFINCQPVGVEFRDHIENCFNALVSECEEISKPEWTAIYFEINYPKKIEQ